MKIDANLKEVDFLDVTLSLKDGLYRPYMKPNNKLLYVHHRSNHPPHVLKGIPETINRRLNSLSATKEIFDEHKEPYQKALESAGYGFKLEYKTQQETNTRARKNRSRNVLWYNPPYSRNVKTNIGKKFLTIIDTCFPKNHPLAKIFNRKTLKISYSCMPNMGKIISKQNRKKLSRSHPKIQPECKCPANKTCLVGGKCNLEGVIYSAKVTRTDSNKSETYTGLTQDAAKKRIQKHIFTFNNQNYKNETSLSSYVWQLKNQNVNFCGRMADFGRGSTI